MKKFLLILFLSTAFFPEVQLFSQSNPNMAVKAFYMSPYTNPANLEGTTVIDQNGDKCALIRVQTTQTGFAWDFGQMAPCKIEQKTGEIWVYVPYGVKRVTIRHAQLGTYNYDLPIPVEKARTYYMELTASNVVMIVEQEITQQWLVFEVTPSNAMVELNGELIENRNGVAKKFVKFGKYDYTVSAKDYYSESGTAQVKDSDKATLVQVNLKPDFIPLLVTETDASRSASIYVDGTLEGTVPCDPIHLRPGKHQIRILRPKYQSFTTTVIAEKGETAIINPELIPKFKKITLTSSEDSEIKSNGEKIGNSPWTGELEYGLYTFEVEKKSCRKVYVTMEITPESPTSIALPEPVPLYGSLNIDSDTGIVDIAIDGNPVGSTPMLRPHIPSGPHTVTFSKQGFETRSVNVTVIEGQTVEVSAVLEKTDGSQVRPSQPVSSSPEKEIAQEPKDKKPSGNIQKKVHKQSISAAFLPLSMKENGSAINFTSISLGYKRRILNLGKRFELVAGLGGVYSSRSDFADIDYKAFSIFAPVDLSCRFGIFGVNAGIYDVINLTGKAASKGKDVDLLKDGVIKRNLPGIHAGFSLNFSSILLYYMYSDCLTSIMNNAEIKVSGNVFGVGISF